MEKNEIRHVIPLKSKVSITLAIIIDVIGIIKRVFSFSIRISPGRWPNQENSFGKKTIATPTTIKTIPMKMSKRPISISRLIKFHRCNRDKYFRSL